MSEKDLYKNIPQEYKDMLTEGVNRVMSEPGFIEWMDAQSKFWTYSPRNTLLILMQRPAATKVASYDTWKNLGRQVQRGEKGVKVFYPMFRPVKTEDEHGEVKVQKVLTGFGLGNVFDLSQTSGKALPEPPAVPTLQGEEGRDVYQSLTQVAEYEKLGIDVWSDSIPQLPTAVGVYEPARKRISHVMSSPLMEAKVLAHELGHHFHLKNAENQTREEEETIAESVAYVVLKHHGLDSGERSFPYISQWAKETNRLTNAMSQIQRVAGMIISTEELAWTTERNRQLKQSA